MTAREHEVIILSAADSLRVAKLLIRPPKPNAALKKAAVQHRGSVAMRLVLPMKTAEGLFR